MIVFCGPRVAASDVSVVSAACIEKKVKGGRAGGRAGRLVVVCSSEPQPVSCCQRAPTVHCSGSWPLAGTGLNRLKAN